MRERRSEIKSNQKYKLQFPSSFHSPSPSPSSPFHSHSPSHSSSFLFTPFIYLFLTFLLFAHLPLAHTQTSPSLSSTPSSTPSSTSSPSLTPTPTSSLSLSSTSSISLTKSSTPSTSFTPSFTSSTSFSPTISKTSSKTATNSATSSLTTSSSPSFTPSYSPSQSYKTFFEANGEAIKLNSDWTLRIFFLFGVILGLFLLDLIAFFVIKYRYKSEEKLQQEFIPLFSLSLLSFILCGVYSIVYETVGPVIGLTSLISFSILQLCFFISSFYYSPSSSLHSKTFATIGMICSIFGLFLSCQFIDCSSVFEYSDLSFYLVDIFSIILTGVMYLGITMVREKRTAQLVSSISSYEYRNNSELYSKQRKQLSLLPANIENSFLISMIISLLFLFPLPLAQLLTLQDNASSTSTFFSIILILFFILEFFILIFGFISLVLFKDRVKEVTPILPSIVRFFAILFAILITVFGISYILYESPSYFILNQNNYFSYCIFTFGLSLRLCFFVIILLFVIAKLLIRRSSLKETFSL